VKHIYSTGVIYDCHLRSSKYFYNTGHSSVNDASRSVNNASNCGVTVMFVMMITICL